MIVSPGAALPYLGWLLAAAYAEEHNERDAVLIAETLSGLAEKAKNDVERRIASSTAAKVAKPKTASRHKSMGRRRTPRSCGRS
ncbi:MAG: hypothetical protein RIF41_35785 [Polyangiaceae bacterium]